MLGFMIFNDRRSNYRWLFFRWLWKCCKLADVRCFITIGHNPDIPDGVYDYIAYNGDDSVNIKLSKDVYDFLVININDPLFINELPQTLLQKLRYIWYRQNSEYFHNDECNLAIREECEKWTEEILKYNLDLSLETVYGLGLRIVSMEPLYEGVIGGNITKHNSRYPTNVIEGIRASVEFEYNQRSITNPL